MCLGAIVQARIKRLVFGAREPKTGAAGSVLNLLDYDQLNHHTTSLGGMLSDECAHLMQSFFRERRNSGSS
jgi:tRNA(adenine34) deaminase